MNRKLFLLFIVIAFSVFVVASPKICVIPHQPSSTNIEIIKAEHLDENREFVEGVYEQVKGRDNIWKEIPSEDYLRVIFERALDKTKDITIYARSSAEGSVEVYEKDSDKKLADFGVISEDKKYKIYLTDLEGSQDVFDLKVVNEAVEFDYVVDPDYVNLSVDGFIAGCTLEYSSVWQNGSTSDNHRSLLDSGSGTYCGWTIEDWSLGSKVIEDIIVFVENVGEAGFNAVLTLYVGNSTTVNVYGTTALTADDAHGDNTIEGNQGDSLNGEQYDMYDTSTDPSTIAEIDDLVIRVGSTDNNDLAGVDHIIVQVTYSEPDSYPTWSDNATNIVTTYLPTQQSYFNITWDDDKNISWVWFESNFSGSPVNYSMMNNFTPSIYNYSAVMPAGSYYWKSYANDSAAQWNVTDTWEFTIAKATGAIKLYINGSEDDFKQNVSFVANITCDLITPNSGNITIYEDGNVLNSTIGSIATHFKTYSDPADYNITCSLIDNNYTGVTNQSWVNATDEIAPNVTLENPDDNYWNDSSAIYPINFTCSATDNYNLKNISLYLTNYQNTSFVLNSSSIITQKSNSSNWTLSLNVGNYTWNCLAYDVYNNSDWGENRTILINYTLDTYPYWSSNATDIVSTYSPTIQSYFNITWGDNGGSISWVWFETNITGIPTNYSMNEIVTDVYNYSAIFPAGGFYWKSYANDSSNQWNVTDTWEFTIDKAQGSIKLYINSSEDDFKNNVSFAVNISCSLLTPTTGNITIYEDGVVLNSTIGSTLSYFKTYTSIADHNITCSLLDHQNYTASNQSWINATDEEPPTVSLDNPPVNYWNDSSDPYPVNFTCSATDNYNLRNISLWLTNKTNGSFVFNRSSVITQTSNYSNWTLSLNVGNYTWNCLVYDEYNNSVWGVNRTISINYSDKPPYWTDNKTNIVTTYSPTTYSLFNITWQDDYSVVSFVWFESNFTGSPVNYSMNNVAGNVYNYSAIMPAGSYYWKSYANDSSNQWNLTDKWEFKVDKAQGSIKLYINSSENDFKYNVSFAVNISCSLLIPTTGNITIYEGGNVLNSTIGPIATYNKTYSTPGDYNITCSLLDHNNYTASNQSWINATDEILPTITLDNPPVNYWNDSSDPYSINFTCSATDNNGLRNISLYLTNKTNQSFAFNSSATITGTSNSSNWTISLANGNYTWNCLVYDEYNNSKWGVNRTILINYTDQPPYWSSNATNIVSTYLLTTQSLFNITWEDDYSVVSFVWFESNFTGTPVNYSMNNVAGNVYNYSAVMPAGSYYWKSYANDSAAQWNETYMWDFTIAKAGGAIKLYINSSENDFKNNVSFAVNISCSLITPLTGNITIYEDDSVLNSTIGSIATHFKTYSSAGDYNITCSLINGNYTGITNQSWVNATDEILPTVTQEYPPANYWNDTSDPFSVNFTCSATDNNNLKNISLYLTNYQNTSFVLNSSAIITQKSNYSNWTLSLSKGNYTWNCLVYDEYNNSKWGVNRTIMLNLTAVADSYPTWSDNATNIVSTYSTSTPSYFNITWQDTNSVSWVWFESNFSGSPVNYSMMNNFTPSIYNYSAIFPAGGFYWKSYANDSLNQWNVTDMWDFTIAKAGGAIKLYINGSENDFKYNVSFAVNISCSLITPSIGNITIYEDGVVLNSTIGSIATYNKTYTIPADYNITCSLENQNYTASNQSWVNATDEENPTITLENPAANYWNHSSDPYAINFTCSATDNYNLKNISLYLTNYQNTSFVLNSSSIITQKSNYSNWTLSLSKGNYTWNCLVYDEYNNSKWGVNRTISINYSDRLPTWSNNATNIVTTYSPTTHSLFNITWQDDYSVSLVYFESNYTGTPVNYSMNEIVTNVYNFSAIMPAGGFYWKSYANDSINRWNETYMWNFTVDKAVGAIKLYINSSEDDFKNNVSFAVNISCSLLTPNSGNITIYEDSSVLNSTYGSIATYNKTYSGIADYNITCSLLNHNNYTASNQSWVNATDEENPTITLEYPPANYWNSSSDPYAVNFTCSATDNYNLKNISLWLTNKSNQSFSLNSSAIITQTSNSSNWTLSLNNGNYTWNCLVYDEYNNSRWGSNRTILINYTDQPPYWSNNATNIVTTYLPTTSSLFNITWQDDYSVSLVYFESNYTGTPVNYSMNNIATNIYNYSAIMPAGSYYWKSYANDSRNNWNQTYMWNFTVAKATGAIKLYINSSENDFRKNVSFAVNISCSLLSPTTGNITIYEGGSVLNSTIGSIATHFKTYSSAGDYNITCSLINSNYTGITNQSWINATDEVLPTIILENPPANYWNDTSDPFSVNFTCSATDNNNLKNISLWLTNKTNQSFVFNRSSVITQTSNYSNWTLSLNIGNYTWNCLVYDEYNNSKWGVNRTIMLNSTTPADNPPYWSSNQTNIVANYSTTTQSLFNITWQDDNNVSFVWFESNFTGTPVNYSMNNVTLNVYNFSAIMPAGYHYWKSYANDSSNQWDVTDKWGFTINKATGTINLYINGSNNNFKKNVSFAVNISCSLITPTSGNITIYEDGSVLNSTIGSIATYNKTYSTPGDYNITCSLLDHQNYTAVNQSWVNASDEIAPTVSLDNPPANYWNDSSDPYAINFTCSTTDNNGLRNISLYLTNNQNTSFRFNSSAIITGSSNSSNWTLDLNVGNYIWNCLVYDDFNNSAWGVNRTIKINWTPDYPPYWSNNQSYIVTTYSPTTQSLFNITWEDNGGSISWVWFESNFTGTPVNYSMNNVTLNVYNYSAIMPTGGFYWRSYANDSKNQWNETPMWNFTVDKATGAIKLYINGSEDDFKQNVSFAVNISCSLITPTSGNITIYEDSSVLNSTIGSIATWNKTYSSIADYNITCSLSDHQNYTASNQSWVNASDEIVPKVSLDNPADNYVNSSDQYVNITFNATVSDNVGLVNCSLWHNISGTWSWNQSQTVTGTSNTTAFNLTDLTNTAFIWNIECYDDGNSAFNDTNRTVILNWTDNIAPTWSNNLTNASSLTKTSESVYFNITFTEANPHNYIFAFYNGSNWVSNYTASFTSGTSIQNITRITATRGMTVQWYFWANDTYGNSNQTDTWSFTVANTAPSFDEDLTNQEVTTPNSLSYDVNCSDADSDTITYYANDTRVEINNSTGIINDAPNQSETGSYAINVTCGDGYDNTSQIFIYTIKDGTAPNISLVTPADNYWNDSSASVSINFSCNATDGYNLRNISLWLTNSTNKSLVFNSSAVITGISNNSNWTISLGIGNYTWNCLAYDEYNNSGWGVNRTLKINYTVDNPPNVTLNTPLDGSTFSSVNVNFNCSISDENAVANVTLYGNWSGSWDINETNSSGINNAEYIFTKTINNGTYIWNCEACDNIGQCSFASSNWTFTIDTVSPNVTLNSPAADYVDSTSDSISLTFNCSATDNYNLKNISLYLTNDQNTSFSLNQTENISGTSNLTTWQLDLVDGEYIWNCLVYDSAGNSAWGNNRSITINYITSTVPPPPPGGGGGSRGGRGCNSDAECREGSACIDHICVKLFDVKIIRSDSPIQAGEFLDFTYYIKGMSKIEDDIVMEFWLEKDNKTITSGSDTIYLGKFEERTETTYLYLPTSVKEGVYDFYVQVIYKDHKTRSHRKIEVIQAIEPEKEILAIESKLDVILLDLPQIKSNEIFKFSVLLGFNKDSPIPVKLKEEIKKEDKVVWSKEVDLVVERTKVITEKIIKLETGNYQLELTAYYENKSSKLVQDFVIEKAGINYIYLLLILFLILLITLLIFLWKKGKIKGIHFARREKFVGEEQESKEISYWKPVGREKEGYGKYDIETKHKKPVEEFKGEEKEHRAGLEREFRKEESEKESIHNLGIIEEMRKLSERKRGPSAEELVEEVKREEEKQATKEEFKKEKHEKQGLESEAEKKPELKEDVKIVEKTVEKEKEESTRITNIIEEMRKLSASKKRPSAEELIEEVKREGEKQKSEEKELKEEKEKTENSEGKEKRY